MSLPRSGLIEILLLAYTSLLRITTTPPPSEDKPETPANAAREESEDEEAVDHDIADTAPSSGLPLPVTAEPPTSAQPQTTDGSGTSSSGGGGLFTRPGFLKGITNRGNGNATRGDLESQL